MGSGARVVEHYIGLAEPRIHLFEQMRDRCRVRRIDREPLGSDLAGERRQFVDIARRQPNREASRREAAPYGMGCWR